MHEQAFTTMSQLNEQANSSFRFLNLNKLQALTIEREVLGASQRKNTSSDSYIACVTLQQDNLEDIVNFFIRQRVQVDDCDLLVSIASCSYSATVEVPNLVNQMLKFIDCKLTISYEVLNEVKQ